MRQFSRRYVRLPEEATSWDDRARRAKGVVLSGHSAGGPEHLSGRVLEVLIAVERRGLHIVLLAHQPEDLDTPVAAVCRHVVAADEDTLQRARARWGASQVVPIETLSPRTVLGALRSIPSPASRTLVRRLHSRSMRLRRMLRRVWQAGPE